MLIGIISDTHDNLATLDRILNEFRSRNVSLVIHLGDVVSPFTLRKIVQFPWKVHLVLGNNDGDALLLRDVAYKAGASIKPYVAELTIEGRKVLAMHGFGSKELTLTLVNAIARSGVYDIVLYGHTHELDVRREGKTFVLNPGEACGYLSGRATAAVLDTSKMEVEVIEVQL